MKTVLVTGGAGYIGSHVVKKLIKNGYKVIVIDDLTTGNRESVVGAELIVGDFADEEILRDILNHDKPVAVIHLAAFKDAEESIISPNKYFENNTNKSKIFLDNVLKYGINNFIFSSTAAVYGESTETPITEDSPVQPVNPYGESKARVERVLLDCQETFGLKSIILRYFNAGGADTELMIGNRYPDSNDVISVLIRTAATDGASFSIFGTDYDTRDGSCIRDMIHVDDVADAHIAALEALLGKGVTGIYNIGSGQGFTVKELITITREITGKDFKVVEAPRRPGEIIVSVASGEKAKNELHWEPKLSIQDIIGTAYAWQGKLNMMGDKL